LEVVPKVVEVVVENVPKVVLGGCAELWKRAAGLGTWRHGGREVQRS